MYTYTYIVSIYIYTYVCLMSTSIATSPHFGEYRGASSASNIGDAVVVKLHHFSTDGFCYNWTAIST